MENNWFSFAEKLLQNYRITSLVISKQFQVRSRLELESSQAFPTCTIINQSRVLQENKLRRMKQRQFDAECMKFYLQLLQFFDRCEAQLQLVMFTVRILREQWLLVSHRLTLLNSQGLSHNSIQALVASQLAKTDRQPVLGYLPWGFLPSFTVWLSQS